MARRPWQETRRDCLGVAYQPGFAVGPRYLRNGQNIRRGTGCMIEKRRGSYQLLDPGDVSAVITGIFQWSPPGNAHQLVLVTLGGELLTAPPAGSTTTITITNEGGPLALTSAPRFAPFRIGATPTLFIASGALAAWDDATLDLAVADAPAAIDVRVYRDRLFAIAGKRLSYTAVADGSKWLPADGGGFADIETYDSADLVRLARCGSSLLLFKADSCSRFTGSGANSIDISVGTEGVSNELGCFAPGTLVELQDAEGVGDAVFCLTRRGPALFTEGGVRLVGDAIASEWRDWYGAAVESSATAEHHKSRQEIWLTISSSVAFPNQRTWIYHYPSGSWWGNQALGFTPRVYGSIVMASSGTLYDGQPFLLASGSDGQLRLLDVPYMERCADDATIAGGLLDGTAVALNATLGHVRGLEPGQEVVVRELVLLGQVWPVDRPGVGYGAGEVRVVWASELGSGSTARFQSASSAINAHRVGLNARGRSIGLTIEELTDRQLQIHEIGWSGYLGRHA